MRDAAVALGASGVLAHVILAVPGRLWQDHEAAKEVTAAAFDPWPHSVDLAEGPARGLHAHCIVPLEAVPGLLEWHEEARAAGIERLVIKRPRYVLPDAPPAVEYIRVVYALPGLVDYVRCRPRVELAKRSNHHRHPSHAEKLAAAQRWCEARTAALAAGRKTVLRASWTRNVPRRPVIERLEVERQDAERLTPLHVLAAVLAVLAGERLEAAAADHRAAVLERKRHQSRRRMPTGTRHHTPRRCRLPGLPERRTAYVRRSRTASPRAPPRRRPRPWSWTPRRRGSPMDF